MTNVAIIGAGGFGKEVNLIIQQLIKKGYNYHFLGYFDDRDLSSELGKNYLGNIKSLNSWKKDMSVVIAIGDGQIRRKIKDSITNTKISFLTLISPKAILNDIIKVGEGSIICAGANLTTEIEVGEFVVINLNATVGHNAQLKSFSSIMPGANLAGNVVLREEAFVGSGANVLNGLTIGNKSVLGTGSVLTKNLADGATAYGVPAKVVNS